MAGLTLYTTSWCGFCRRLKGRLDKAGVSYQEIDIEADADGASFVESVNDGKRTVPVVVLPDGTAQTNPEPRDVLRAVG